jgi:hypothetical protein
MGRDFSFSGEVLGQAIAATFSRRKTELPLTLPVALTEAFFKDEAKNKQWTAFCTRGGLSNQVGGLEEVVNMLNGFLVPPLSAAAHGEPFSQQWPAGGPWRTQIV